MSLENKKATSVMLENFMNVDRIKASAQSSQRKKPASKKEAALILEEEEKPAKKRRGRPPMEDEAVRISVILPKELRMRAERTVAEMKFEDPDSEVKNFSDFVRLAIEEKLQRLGK